MSGTQRALVLSHPWSGLLQGAETYLRAAASRRGTHPETAAQLGTILQEWDRAMTRQREAELRERVPAGG